MKRQRIWVVLGALVVVVALGGLVGFQQFQQADDGSPKGGPVELPSTQGDFSLTQLEDDQLAVLFFGYTYCPDVCPMSMAVMRQVMQGLEEDQRRRVVPVLISVDPERDTIERLTEYVGYFGDDFIGATGSQAQLEELAARYGVIWRRVETPDSAMEYTIDHSSSIYLVDRHGTILQRVLYSPTPHPLRSALEHELGG
ncbi:MAG: SCO family protein [Halomonas sp.]|jgi:protein SCO1/2|uniref:SCO family protein n=1 Tax=Halomonadaceae TaxID=28256 RepID=UPI00191697AB|nr:MULTISPECIES: SCO family protein [Halomonas]MCE8035395.1 SCO family protein [Halomonas sp. MCCC 1A11057]MDX5433342.1 SCO family protein [Halomonas sp.]